MREHGECDGTAMDLPPSSTIPTWTFAKGIPRGRSSRLAYGARWRLFSPPSTTWDNNNNNKSNKHHLRCSSIVEHLGLRGSSMRRNWCLPLVRVQSSLAWCMRAIAVTWFLLYCSFQQIKKVLSWALKFLSWQTPKVADTGAITVVEQDAVVTSESRWIAPTSGPNRHSCYSEDDRCPGLCTSQDIAASHGEDLWPASPQATPPGTGSPTPTNTSGSAIQHNLETFACGWRSNNSFSFRQWRCLTAK